MSTLRLVFALLLVVTALPAAAETTVRTGNQFELPADQRIEGNFLGVGNPVSQSGVVEGDTLLLGNQVTVTGETGADVLAAGILTRLDGVVTGDARVLGGTVTVTGSIAGDLIAVADTVEILSGAEIGGDVLLYARTASVAGDVGGSVKGSSNRLQINGAVAGAVDVSVGYLDLGATASITESVRYASRHLLTQNIDTVVGGPVLRNDPVYINSDASLRSTVMPLIALLFATLLWLYLSRKTLDGIVVRTTANIPRSAVTGTVAFLVVPLIVFVLLLSLLGTYVALVVLVGYALLVLMACAVLPAVIGHWVMRFGKNQAQQATPLSILVGAIVCGLLFLLPTVGVVMLFFLGIIVFGGLVESIIRASR